MATTGTLKYKLYQDEKAKSKFKGMWYGRAVQDRTVDFDGFVNHMAGHASPYSRGVINGVLMDQAEIPFGGVIGRAKSPAKRYPLKTATPLWRQPQDQF